MNIEEKIEFGRYTIREISEKFLLEGQPFVILPGSEYLRECLTLYAKQTNMFESVLTLIEHNHAEEAYILVRSMLNNAMLIDYLCTDTQDETRYKNYLIQPIKSELSFLYNVKKAVRKGWIEAPSDLGQRIKKYEKYLKDEGFVIDSGPHKGKSDNKLLTVSEMASQDKLLFGTYMLFYREGSQYEHSDISSLNIYRQSVSEDVPDTTAFVMDLSRTDEELIIKVLNLGLTFYGLTFTKLLQHISNTSDHIIREENRKSLLKLMYEIASLDFIRELQVIEDQRPDGGNE